MLLEDFVVMELRKQTTWSGVQAEVLYWRTASGQEVDVVLEDRAGRIAGIEIKAAATLSGSDVRGLQALATTAGKAETALLRKKRPMSRATRTECRGYLKGH
jgi:hypothetical protein